MSLLTRIGEQFRHLIDAVSHLFEEGRARREAATFAAAIIALSAKAAKADGRVTQDEVAAFLRICEAPPGQETRVRFLFDLAKGSMLGFESYARQIAHIYDDRPDMLADVLDALFAIAAADGVMHEDELLYLEEVARIFGLDGPVLRRLKARRLRGPASDAYAALETDSSADDEEIKRHYRRLVKENHPDRLAARGLPPEFLKLANERLAALNAAYETIRLERRAVTSVPDVQGVLMRPSPNHDERRGPIDILLLHYTGMRTADDALHRLRDPNAKVSAHYLIYEDGRIVQLVSEERRAWHAGVSFWAGETDVNSRSIGIEIANPGHEGGSPPFPDAQIEAVIRLGRGIVKRRAIPPERVLAHSDVAPSRKRDPGERFPWARLAEAGVGAYVAPAPLSDGGPVLRRGDRGLATATLKAGLARFGYGLSPGDSFDERTEHVVTAFQRRFRPARIDGAADLSTLETLRRALRTLERETI